VSLGYVALPRAKATYAFERARNEGLTVSLLEPEVHGISERRRKRLVGPVDPFLQGPVLILSELDLRSDHTL
jgi:hypothetical protein